MRPRSRARRLVPWLAAALAALAVVCVVAVAQRLPDGPQPIAWDREPCAHCHMLIGEPAFAAQLVAADGQVFNFDDPGCLFTYLVEKSPAVHAMWFHHVREDRWLRADQTAFTTVSPTPMGYGLGAVDKGTPDTLDLAAAQHRVTRQGGSHAPRD